MAKQDKRAAEAQGGGDVKKLRKLIKSTRIAMLTTVASDGTLRSRPMATLGAPFDGYLYFFTRAGSPKADEIQDNQQVNLAYGSPDDDRYVSVSGTASVARDPEKLKELWSGWMKAWFPQGKKDPELALLKVRVQHGEYWDAKSNAMVQMVGLLKALVTGQSADDLGENQKVDVAPVTNPIAGAQG